MPNLLTRKPISELHPGDLVCLVDNALQRSNCVGKNCVTQETLIASCISNQHKILRVLVSEESESITNQSSLTTDLIIPQNWLNNSNSFTEFENIIHEAYCEGSYSIIIFDILPLAAPQESWDALNSLYSSLRQGTDVPKAALITCINPKFYAADQLLNILTAHPWIFLNGDLLTCPYYVVQNIEEQQGKTPSPAEHLVQLITHAFPVVDELRDTLKTLAQTEDQLAKLSAIIDCLGDGIFVVDEHGQMLYCNESSKRILGYGWSELPFEERVSVIGNFLPDMVTPYPPHELPIARAMRGESVDQAEIFIKNDRKPEGAWISVTTRPLTDRRNKLRGAVSVFRDMTKQKRAEQERERFEEQIFRSQKLESLGVLAGGIAHDFNNLLVGVLGNADLVMSEVTAGSSAHSRVAQIQLASHRLSELTHQLLAYAGKGDILEGPLSLTALVQEMVGLIKPVLSRKAEVFFDIDPHLPTFVGDATQIRQVIMNLIKNASDALLGQTGKIVVRTGCIWASSDYLADTYLDDQLAEGDYIFFEVEDSGCGMDEETLSRIFDPFYTTKFTGRGLGLAAALGIVRRHHGAIKVQSTLNSGTIFRVLFPLVGRPMVEAEIRRKPKTNKKDDWSGWALVVDDEESVREVSQIMLQRFGFQVYTAASGQEALRLFRDHAADIRLVLLDMTMPDMSGEEVFLKLRRIPSSAKVVMSSGYPEHDVARRLARAGVSAFLQKPYGSDKMDAAIRVALGSD